MRRTLVVAVVGTAALALAGAGMLPADAGDSGPPVRSTSSTHDKDKLRETALAAGIQVAPKHRTLSQVKVHGKLVNQANPYLGMVRNPAKVDFSYWGRQADRQSAKRQPQSKVPVPTPFAYDEKEPAGELGSTTPSPTPRPSPSSGSGRASPRPCAFWAICIQPAVATDDIKTAEDQGAIPIATDTGIPADQEGITVRSEIGDGPHGSAGTGAATSTSTSSPRAPVR